MGLADSADAHRGRIASGASINLIEDVAPALVTDDAIVPAPEDVLEILSQNALRMRGRGGEPGGVMVSNLPLATAGEGPTRTTLADLSIVPSGSGYRVSRPVVPVEIPREAGGPVRIGDRISVRLTDADRHASGIVHDESVVYPSIAPDTDMVVRSLPTGVQVGWLLRSPEADTVMRVPVNLKPGQRLVKSPIGSVQVVDPADGVVAEISLTTAVDADKRGVPVATELDGDEVVYTVDHAKGKVKYPVLTDPQISDVHWDDGSSFHDTNDGWFSQNTPNSNGPYLFGRQNRSSPNRGQLAILGPQQAGYAQTAAGAWARFAPGDPTFGSAQASGRKVSPEHGYWYRFDAGALAYSVYPSKTEHYGNYPASAVGMLDRDGYADTRTTWAFMDANGNPGSGTKGQMFNKLPSGTTSTSASIWLGDSPQDTARAGNGATSYDNTIGFGLNAIAPYYYWQNEHPLSAMGMGWYRAWASDAVAPRVSTSAPGDGRWTSAPPSTVAVSADDRGMGLRSVRLERAASPVSDPQVLSTPSAAPQCSPNSYRVCDFTWSGTLATTAMPEGRSTTRITAVDGDGLTSTKTLTYAIDKTAPLIPTISGDLYTRRGEDLKPQETRSLTVGATDGVAGGTGESAQSGVERIDVYLDDELVHSERQTSADDNQALAATWSADAQAIAAGPAQVRVVATDRVGQSREIAFAFVKSPSPDETTPIADAGGDFNDLEGGFVPNLGSIGVLLLGDDPSEGIDPGSGMDRLGLQIDGVSSIDEPASCDVEQDNCPEGAARELPVNIGGLPEGRHSAQSFAKDKSGKVGYSDSWNFFVDRTAPTPIASATATQDNATNEVVLKWYDDNDPDLKTSSESDPQPGSGVVSWRVRWAVLGLFYGDWATVTEDPALRIPNQLLGLPVSVQVESKDAAGNTAVATRSALVEADPGDSTADYPASPASDPDEDTTSPLLRQVRPPGVYCDEGRDAGAIELGRSRPGPEGVTGIEGRVTLRCYIEGDPAKWAAAYRNITASATACIDWDDAGTWKTLPGSCTKKVPFKGTPRQFRAEGLCMAGTPRYRIRVRIDLSLKKAKRGQFIIDGDRKLATRALGCDEAGAFRRNAKNSIQGRRAPSTILGGNLRAGNNLQYGTNDADPLPTKVTSTGNGGWEAHHIIPVGETNATIGRAQAGAWGCQVPPNAAVNGIWARTRAMDARRSPAGYKKLKDAGKGEERRVMHSTTFVNQRYFSEVVSFLVGNNQADNTCTNRSGFFAALRNLRRELKTTPYYPR